MELSDIFYYEWHEGLDWVPVVSVDIGGGYDWDEFHAWYSPSARKYFWGSGSGCSCNSFSQEFYGPEDFSNGNRDALKSALGLYFDETYLNHNEERVRALSAVRDFRTPK